MSHLKIEKICPDCLLDFEQEDFRKCIYCDDRIACYKCCQEHFIDKHFSETDEITDSEFEGLEVPV